jgi:hypothetical protein
MKRHKVTSTVSQIMAAPYTLSQAATKANIAASAANPKRNIAGNQTVKSMVHSE